MNNVLTEKQWNEWLEVEWDRCPASAEEIEGLLASMYPKLERGSREWKERLIVLSFQV